MAHYEKVRFLGYAVPTTPANMIGVGDPNGHGAAAGTYRAAADLATDVRARAGFLKTAVDTARAVLPPADGVLNVFVAPEFYWHGPMGPYVHAPGDPDPAELILRELGRLFPAAEYPDFLLVLGTVITAEVADIDTLMETSSVTVRNDVVRALGQSWQSADGSIAQVVLDTLVNFIKNCHTYSQVEVRNRAMVLGPAELHGVVGPLEARAITTEKYFDSNEDLLLWDVTGRPVITEQMSAYPILDISGGDLKTSDRDPYAVFRVPGTAPVTVGVEICLDHSDERLRKGAHRSPWPRPGDGIDLHLVPSCGMNLHPAAVAARSGGWAFNCDGQYTLGDASQTGRAQRGTVDGVPSVFVDYVDQSAGHSGAHTQLARVRVGPQGEEHQAGARDAEFAPAADLDVTVVPVAAGADFGNYFAGGPGAVHIYGKDRPGSLT